MEIDAADDMLTKLRGFMAESLSPDERALLAALIAPGAALAFSADEVRGYASSLREIHDLPEPLVHAIRRVGVEQILSEPGD